VTYVGVIKKYKQLDHLITAFARVRDEVPEAELVIAGRRDHTELEKQARSLGLKKAVSFREDISEEEKVAILQRAWVFVTPSVKEGWGISVIEANACGTPAIAYDVPGLRDSIQNGRTGWLVPSGDIEALAATITQVLTESQLREGFCGRAREWAANFTWDRSAAAFFKLLEKTALNGRKGEYPVSSIAFN